MSVSSNKVVVVVVLVKNTFKVFLISSYKLSGALQTSCARLFRVSKIVGGFHDGRLLGLLLPEGS